MSSDGKVIVYDDNFGIWKLDVASGRSTEIKLDIATDEKENEVDIETVTNDVDAFDISPSGRRAVISARGQILTIATDRGDITRLAPDKMSSRNDAPKWSCDGKYIAFISDRSGRDEIWISEAESKNPKKITDLDNEKGALVGTPDSKASSTPPRTRSCTARASRTRRPRSSHRPISAASGRWPSPRTANGSRSRSRTGHCVPTSTSRRSVAAKSATSRTTVCSTPRTTPSGPPTAATSSSRRRKERTTALRRRVG